MPRSGGRRSGWSSRARWKHRVRRSLRSFRSHTVDATAGLRESSAGFAIAAREADYRTTPNGGYLGRSPGRAFRRGPIGNVGCRLVVEEVEDYGQALLNELAERGDNEGIEVVTRCCHGIPQEEIVAYADEIDADLIIVGYQGQSHRNRIGSVHESVALVSQSERTASDDVAERVVRHAGRPVLTA